MTKQRKKTVPLPPAASSTVGHGAGERLQKILAGAGLGSRRDCEELILAGRVEVDRKVVDTLGSKADPHTQEIRVDGEVLPRPKLVHYMVHKPAGVVSTNADPAGRPRVIDLVPRSDSHLFAVGRLDISSEGLILVTNDGELANRLTHPRYEVEKTYLVEVAGALSPDDLKQLRRGIHLAEGFAKVKGARIKKQLGKSTLLEMILKEGKNREIRRVLAKVGHKVLRLRRVAIGPLRLGELPAGTFRPLTYAELDKLRGVAFSSPARQASRPQPAGRRHEASAPRGKVKRPRNGKPGHAKPADTTSSKRGFGSIIGGDKFSAKPTASRPKSRGKKQQKVR